MFGGIAIKNPEIKFTEISLFESYSSWILEKFYVIAVWWNQAPPRDGIDKTQTGEEGASSSSVFSLSSFSSHVGTRMSQWRR